MSTFGSGTPAFTFSTNMAGGSTVNPISAFGANLGLTGMYKNANGIENYVNNAGDVYRYENGQFQKRGVTYDPTAGALSTGYQVNVNPISGAGVMRGTNSQGNPYLRQTQLYQDTINNSAAQAPHSFMGQVGYRGANGQMMPNLQQANQSWGQQGNQWGQNPYGGRNYMQSQFQMPTMMQPWMQSQFQNPAMIEPWMQNNANQGYMMDTSQIQQWALNNPGQSYGYGQMYPQNFGSLPSGFRRGLLA